jgi:hypothetical protein
VLPPSKQLQPGSQQSAAVSHVSRSSLHVSLGLAQVPPVQTSPVQQSPSPWQAASKVPQAKQAPVWQVNPSRQSSLEKHPEPVW